MSVVSKVKVAVLEGNCGPEDAEVLLQWLIEHPQGQVNLKLCEHLHSAILQVMLVSNTTISVWPQSHEICTLLNAAGYSKSAD
jgi:ribosome maturation factor RimP